MFLFGWRESLLFAPRSIAHRPTKHSSFHPKAMPLSSIKHRFTVWKAQLCHHNTAALLTPHHSSVGTPPLLCGFVSGATWALRHLCPSLPRHYVQKVKDCAAVFCHLVSSSFFRHGHRFCHDLQIAGFHSSSLLQQSYKINRTLPNIYATFFKYFLK